MATMTFFTGGRWLDRMNMNTCSELQSRLNHHCTPPLAEVEPQLDPWPIALLSYVIVTR